MRVQDPAAELQKLGGAKVILATVTSADAMKAVIGGLAPTGTFMIVGAVPSLEVPALQLLLKSQQVKGWYSGTSLDSQETLAFSVLSGVRSMNESYPLERASEAYERMMSGKARFRVSAHDGESSCRETALVFPGIDDFPVGAFHVPRLQCPRGNCPDTSGP